jgi:hypothetical protein
MGTFIVVGASITPLPPPFVSNVQHWWDFTDAPTVFSDILGTILAGEGDPIRNVTNKGYDGQPLIEAGAAVPEYNLAFINGLNVATNVGGNALTTILGNALSVTGLTAVIVLRSQDAGGSPNPLNWDFAGDASVMQADIAGSGNWEVIFNDTDEKDTLKLVVPDEFVWLYGAISETFSIDYRASGGNLQSGVSGYPVTDAGLTMNVADFIGNVAEVIIYDKKLTAAEQVELTLYLDNKYDGLPEFIPSGPVPPAIGNLLHWVDAADAATVWADAGGTIPATNGVTVERIDNKGSRGTPFLRVGFGGVEYKTGVLNGLNVIEFTSISGQLSIIAESPGLPISTTGMTMAMVTRRISATPPSGTQILWRWTPFGGVPGPGLRLDNFSADLKSVIDGIPDEDFVTPAVVNTWYLIYISLEPSGSTNDAKFGSPGPEIITPFGDPTDIPDLADFRWSTGSTPMEHAEAWFWDRPLTLTERADLVTYANTKYGALPHL